MPREAESQPCDRLYVEIDWHDGPRSGIADLLGQPHRFESVYDPALGGYSDYLLVAVDEETLHLELEQHEILLQWQAALGAGLATAEDHPAKGGNARWDELEVILAPRRIIDPALAHRALATVVPVADNADPPAGPGYAIRWQLLSERPLAP